MRRFTVAVSGAGESGPWLETGFVEFVPGQDEDGRPRRPDVHIISPDSAGWEEVVAESWPKVIFFTAAAPPALPAELAEAYRPHRWQPNRLSFTLATRLEIPLTEPQWEAYFHKDILTPSAAAKAVADTIYRHLLADIFRDTAEWCGHTFSVVTAG